MRSPVELMADIESHVEQLDFLSKQLEEATRLLNSAEAEWTATEDAGVIKIQETHDKLPPADVRLSMVRSQNRKAWNETQRGKRLVNLIEKQITVVRAQLNGRQSELSAQKAGDAYVSGGQTPDWSK